MAHQQPVPGGPASPYAISLIRTGVPLLWGYAAAWLINLGVPLPILDRYHDTVVTALGAILSFGWYALWRWLETKIPSLDSWTARLLVMLALGKPGAPAYPQNVTSPTSTG